MNTAAKLMAGVAAVVILAGCQSSSSDENNAVGQLEGDREQNVATVDGGDGNVKTTRGCIDSDVQQERMLALVNAIRSVPQQCGDVNYPAAPALAWSERIEAAALKHSEFMAESRTLEHVGENGSNLGDRLRDENYVWVASAENIAFGFGTPEAAVTVWLNSAGHCKNLMNSRVTEFAVSCADTQTGRSVRYWTQAFARPAE